MTEFQELPRFMSRDNTCFFTGHRAIPAEQKTALGRAVEKKIYELAKRDYIYFMAGGALGFDMFAESIVLRAARQTPNIKLVLALPCIDQTLRWGALPNFIEIMKEYKRISGLAECVYYVSDVSYYNGCMQKRNQFMVDHSSVCIAYYNGSRYGGTKQTVGMAARAGIEICNLCENNYAV